MKVDTALNHQKLAIQATRDLWRSARVFHLSHKTILERRDVIMARLDKCPRWVRETVLAVNSEYLHQVYDYLEFCYMGKDGVLYSTHKKSKHRSTEEFYSSGRGHELFHLQGDHYWRGSKDKF